MTIFSWACCFHVWPKNTGVPIPGGFLSRFERHKLRGLTSCSVHLGTPDERRNWVNYLGLNLLLACCGLFGGNARSMLSRVGLSLFSGHAWVYVEAMLICFNPSFWPALFFNRLQHFCNQHHSCKAYGCS
jgi:hypothetical protein